MIRRIIPFILVIIAVFLLFAGCNNNSQTTNTPTSMATTVSTEPISDNPLIAAELQRGFVLNGSKTDVIGQYAYIKISKSTLKEITLEEYTEFCETVVDNIIYNWVSIICDDGTGIEFPGSQYVLATYGTIDYEGIIIQDMGTIKQTENGFVYEDSIVEEAEANGSDLSLYPKDVGEEYVALANELPDIIFTTTGEENGLPSTIYTFTGKVLNIVEYDSDGFTFYDATIETTQGNVQVTNIYKSIYDVTYELYGDEIKLIYTDDVSNYTFPEIGTSARFIGIYSGYSGKTEMPVFYLGASKSLFGMCGYADPVVTSANTPPRA